MTYASFLRDELELIPPLDLSLHKRSVEPAEARHPPPALPPYLDHTIVIPGVSSLLASLPYNLTEPNLTKPRTFLIDRPAFEAVGRGTMVGLDLPE